MDASKTSPKIIKRSPAALAIKIIFGEIMLDIAYLIFSFSLSLLESQGIASNVEPARYAAKVMLAVMGVGLIAVPFAQWAAHSITIRNSEIEVKDGLIKTKSTAYPMMGIQSVEVKQSLIGRLLNYGSAYMYVPVLGRELEFTELPSPHDVAEAVKELIPKPERQQFVLKRS